MSVERKQFGAQSVTYYVYNEIESDENLTVANWALLPSGKLKDLLNRTYLTVGGDVDPAAFMQALASAGEFHVTTQYESTDISDAYWTLSPGPGEDPNLPVKGSPILTVEWNAFGTVVRITTSYSASE